MADGVDPRLGTTDDPIDVSISGAPAPTAGTGQGAPVTVDPKNFVAEGQGAGGPPTVSPENFTPEATPSSSLNERIYRPKVLATAKALGMTDEQAQAFAGLIKHESGFNPLASGTPDPNTGHQAQGLGQMFPAALQDSGFADKDMSDPNNQIAASAAYFKQKLDKYDGNTDMAGMAYNAGDNPKNWKPAYALAMRKAAGQPMDPQFHALAGQLYQQQHAAADPQSDTPPWDFEQNTANNLILGAKAPLDAMADAWQNGQSYETERTLNSAWQRQWLADHPVASMVSDVAGLAVPDTIAAKGLMAGGRMAAEAAPVVGRMLGPLLGLGDGFTPVKAGLTAIPRASAAGAGLGVLNSQTNPDPDLAKDATFGAAAGPVGATLGALGKAVGKGVTTVARASPSLVSEGSMYNQAKQGLSQLLGTASPQLTPSTTPGVEYSLPEMLGGANPDANAKLARVAAADPASYQQQIMNNNAARVTEAQNIVEDRSAIDDLMTEKRANNNNITTLMQATNTKKGATAFGLDLSAAKKHAEEILNDRSKNKIPGMQDEMHEALRIMHEPAPPGPKPKEVGTLADLAGLGQDHDFEAELEKEMQGLNKEQPKQLVHDPMSVHGVWRALGALIDNYDKPSNTKDTSIKNELVQIKKLVDQELLKVPSFRPLMNKSGQISERIKEREFLQSFKLTDIQDMLKPAVLDNMISKIEKSHLYRGVLGTANKAKSVLPETLERLKALRADIAISKAAKVPIAVSSTAKEGEVHNPVFNHLLSTGGGAGFVAGHELGVPGGGPAGFVAGKVLEHAYRATAKKAAARMDKTMLDVMLHPTQHPLVAPKAPTVPGGFYSGMFGGNALNGLTQGGSPQQRKKS